MGAPLASLARRSLRQARAPAHVLEAGRSISSSGVICLPRQSRTRAPLPSTSRSSAPWDETSESALSSPSFSTSWGIERKENMLQDSRPWFLQEDEVDEQVLPTPTPSTIPLSTTGEKLPDTLVELHTLLNEGKVSPLIRRSDKEELVYDDHMATKAKPPIVYIHAKSLDPDAWANWIVIVEVKSKSGGSVSRVAKEMGTFLKYHEPPSDETVTSLEDFIGSAEPKRNRRSSKGQEIEAKTNKDKQEEEKSTNRSWQPRKILSREAQDGLRLLHAHDPEQYSRQNLARNFKISVESVRRILKSNWRPPGEVVGRQNRRARERDEERKKMFMEQREWANREQEEIAKIRGEVEKVEKGGGEEAEEREADALDEPEEWQLEGEEDMELGRGKKQNVIYEGLVEGDAGGRGRSASSRGHGEWCLIDAGWCITHVMTSQARERYDVEGIWKKERLEPDLSQKEDTNQLVKRRIRSGEVPL